MIYISLCLKRLQGKRGSVDRSVQSLCFCYLFPLFSPSSFLEESARDEMAPSKFLSYFWRPSRKTEKIEIRPKKEIKTKNHTIEGIAFFFSFYPWPSGFFVFFFFFFFFLFPVFVSRAPKKGEIIPGLFVYKW